MGTPIKRTLDGTVYGTPHRTVCGTSVKRI